MAASSDPPRRLSVAMIARNEEDVLGPSIESVRGVADEILVLDTGSTDQTPAVAKRMGAAVLRAAWSDDFSAARNHLLAEVTGDWVLWLDAGERLSLESVADLRRFLDQEADPQNLYTLTVEIPPADPSASAEQAARPRLIPARAGLRFTGRVCETLEPSMEAAGLALDVAPGRLLRHRRQHDPNRKRRLAQRDLKLVALEAADRGSLRPRLLILLGEALGTLGDQPAARQAFRKALRDVPPGSTEMLEAYYGLLGTFDGQPSQRDLQLSVCREALDVYPHDAQLLCVMGSYLLGQNRYDAAAQAFQTALRHGNVDPRTWHLREIAEMAAVFLSLTLQTHGKNDEARRVLEQALARHETSVRLRRPLIDAYIKEGRSREAVRLAEGMALDRGQQAALRDAVRGACRAASQEWLSALGLLQAAYVAGCRDPLCLRWLSVTLLSNGQAQAARPILDEWLRQEPANAEIQAYLEAVERDKIGGAATGRSTAVQSCPSRWIRIDPGMTVMDVTPAPVPIICQASSTDPILDGNR